MTKSEKYGKAQLRWQPQGDGWAGTVIRDGSRSEIIRHSDEEQLLAALRNQAGKLEPNYFGFEEAMKRYLRFKPGGFAGDSGSKGERSYKEAAAASLNAALSPQDAINANDDDAKRVARSAIWINMLSSFETARLRETLLSADGPEFVKSAARFLQGDRQLGIDGMIRALSPHGRISWPLITYLPFLWNFRAEMYLKPTVTLDFSQRTGLSFHHDYDATPSAAGYADLLTLVDQTRSAISDLHPRDNLDIQSFIWVVGEYREEDLP